MDESYRLAMQDQLAELEEELQEIRDELDKQDHIDRLTYRATERSLQLLVETCIGIAKQTLKSQGVHVPVEARKAFEKLKSQGQDNSDIAWPQVIGLRNALVHDYLNLDRERIIEIVKTNRYRALIEYAKDKLASDTQQ